MTAAGKYLLEGQAEALMLRALRLARRGELDAHPNPMVGAVIADDSGLILGEGWHRQYGHGHAEVNAVADARKNGVTDFTDKTIFVTLEPCSHYGKTPPCARLLADLRFKRVVIGGVDPNPKVSGRGIEILRQAGIEVQMASEEVQQACAELNDKFLFACTHPDRPFITLKWAQNGVPDLKPPSVEAIRGQISTPTTLTLTHRLRAIYDAILVGSGTVLADNPSLTTRCYAGKDPLRVILDRRSRVSPDAKVFADDNVAYFSDHYRPDLPAQIQHPGDKDFLKTLLSMGITSLLVEGGAEILNYFISHNLYDTIRVEYKTAQGNKILELKRQ